MRIRDFKREAKSAQYRGGHAALMPGFEHQTPRIEAAVAKRERKAQKRIDDAYQAELGSRASAERLDGKAI